MTFKTEPRWWIEVEPMLGIPNETRHTMVKFEIVGQYFTKFACSCGAQSDNLPSLRPENVCDVCDICAADACPVVFHDDIEANVCDDCYKDFAAWLIMNPELPAIDWLRETISNG